MRTIAILVTIIIGLRPTNAASADHEKARARPATQEVVATTDFPNLGSNGTGTFATGLDGKWVEYYIHESSGAILEKKTNKRAQLSEDARKQLIEFYDSGYRAGNFSGKTKDRVEQYLRRKDRLKDIPDGLTKEDWALTQAVRHYFYDKKGSHPATVDGKLNLAACEESRKFCEVMAAKSEQAPNGTPHYGFHSAWEHKGKTVPARSVSLSRKGHSPAGEISSEGVEERHIYADVIGMPSVVKKLFGVDAKYEELSENDRMFAQAWVCINRWQTSSSHKRSLDNDTKPDPPWTHYCFTMVKSKKHGGYYCNGIFSR